MEERLLSAGAIPFCRPRKLTQPLRWFEQRRAQLAVFGVPQLPLDNRHRSTKAKRWELLFTLGHEQAKLGLANNVSNLARTAGEPIR